MLSHRNLIETARNAIEREGLRAAEEVWRICPWRGSATTCSPSASRWWRASPPTARRARPRCCADLQGDRPDLLLRAAPHLGEHPHLGHDPGRGRRVAQARAWSASSSTLARRVERRRLAHRSPALLDRLLYPLGRLLVYGPLRDNLACGRSAWPTPRARRSGPELFEFYRSLGVNVKQLYGMTESSALICIQQDGDVKLDTVGTPLPGVEVRISRAGEVLYRSPGVFQGYYKNPEATRRDARRRLGPLGRRGLPRQGRPPQDHRPGPRRGPARGRHAVRAQVPREQAQVLALRQGGGVRRARAGRSCAALDQHRPRPRSAAGRSGANSPTRATPISPRSPRSTS